MSRCRVLCVACHYMASPLIAGILVWGRYISSRHSETQSMSLLPTMNPDYARLLFGVYTSPHLIVCVRECVRAWVRA